MADRVIVCAEQVTTEWLSRVLRASGALSRGGVAGFDLEAGGGNWSDHLRIALRYTPGARGDLPRRLFLKMVNTDLEDEFFDDSEVRYYTRDYVDVPDVPLVRCYDGAYSAELQRYHLLLDDLTKTHHTAKKMTLEYGLALADGFAAMHARWWGARGLAEAGVGQHSAAHIQRFVDIAAPGVDHIVARFAPELKPHWPQAMRDLYARHPRAIVARTADNEGFTLIHGDAGIYNVMVPRQGERPIYILDRQPFDWSLTVWLGVYDLAYAVVLYADPEVRRRIERPVLRRYHEQLIARGVQGYPWERLWEDYRLCVPMGVYIATEYCRSGINEPALPYWLPKLQRSLAACDDLDCSALW